jgi:hypothetical protein
MYEQRLSSVRNKLNEVGIERFNEYLVRLKSQPAAPIPLELLNSPDTSSPIGMDAWFDPGAVFKSRHDCGSYVAEQLKHAEKRHILDDRGLWSALALLWFDQLCPADKRGNRKPKRADNYILSDNSRQVMRHSVRTAWQLASLYGEDTRFLQSREMKTRGELIEQLLATNYYINCEGVIRTASTLYSDHKTGSFKKGAGNKVAGGVRRYVAWLKQIKQTYDLFSMSHEELLNILPGEFDRFRQ